MDVSDSEKEHERSQSTIVVSDSDGGIGSGSGEEDKANVSMPDIEDEGIGQEAGPGEESKQEDRFLEHEGSKGAGKEVV